MNTAKSKVMVFNSRAGGTHADPVFVYGGAQLSVEAEFKYLGLVFHISLNMTSMQERWARALLGSSVRARRIAQRFGVHKDALAGLRLFQTFAFSSGMYGCQVWGTRFARIDRVIESAISTLAVWQAKGHVMLLYILLHPCSRCCCQC